MPQENINNNEICKLITLPSTFIIQNDYRVAHIYKTKNFESIVATA
jgi:hypothetical protein